MRLSNFARLRSDFFDESNDQINGGIAPGIRSVPHKTTVTFQLAFKYALSGPVSQVGFGASEIAPDQHALTDSSDYSLRSPSLSHPLGSATAIFYFFRISTSYFARNPSLSANLQGISDFL